MKVESYRYYKKKLKNGVQTLARALAKASMATASFPGVCTASWLTALAISISEQPVYCGEEERTRYGSNYRIQFSSNKFSLFLLNKNNIENLQFSSNQTANNIKKRKTQYKDKCKSIHKT